MSSAPAVPFGAAKHRILVIDDEEIVLVGLRETLRRAGYEVVTGSNALAGLDALKSGPFAVVLSDQQMPWMTGLELLAQVKDVQPNASRILITAVLSLETVVEAINKGEIYRFIIKPWLREELLATVTNAVQRYELVCRHADLQATTVTLNQQLTDLNRSLGEQAAQLTAENQQLKAESAQLAASLQRGAQVSLHLLQTLYPGVGVRMRRVVALCRAIADTVDLPGKEREIFELSSQLFDIGLAGVPGEIIERWQTDSENLNEAERRLIEQHPILGQELVRCEGPLDAVGAVIRSHHERFDGRGYPDHLAGDQIPWLGRLLAVAVGYVHNGLGSPEAIEQLRELSGTAFDPEAIRVLIRALPNVKYRRKEREILLSELRPGMILARGIYTANGLLLMPEDQPLSEPEIEKMHRHNQVHAITQSLYVYC